MDKAPVFRPDSEYSSSDDSSDSDEDMAMPPPPPREEKDQAPKADSKKRQRDLSPPRVATSDEEEADEEDKENRGARHAERPRKKKAKRKARSPSPEPVPDKEEEEEEGEEEEEAEPAEHDEEAEAAEEAEEEEDQEEATSEDEAAAASSSQQHRPVPTGGKGPSVIAQYAADARRAEEKALAEKAERATVLCAAPLDKATSKDYTVDKLPKAGRPVLIGERAFILCGDVDELRALPFKETRTGVVDFDAVKGMEPPHTIETPLFVLAVEVTGHNADAAYRLVETIAQEKKYQRAFAAHCISLCLVQRSEKHFFLTGVPSSGGDKIMMGMKRHNLDLNTVTKIRAHPDFHNPLSFQRDGVNEKTKRIIYAGDSLLPMSSWAKLALASDGGASKEDGGGAAAKPKPKAGGAAATAAVDGSSSSTVLANRKKCHDALFPALKSVIDEIIVPLCERNQNGRDLSTTVGLFRDEVKKGEDFETMVKITLDGLVERLDGKGTRDARIAACFTYLRRRYAQFFMHAEPLALAHLTAKEQELKKQAQPANEFLSR